MPMREYALSPRKAELDASAGDAGNDGGDSNMDASGGAGSSTAPAS